jgi:hypothetical protein
LWNCSPSGVQGGAEFPNDKERTVEVADEAFADAGNEPSAFAPRFAEWLREPGRLGLDDRRRFARSHVCHGWLLSVCSIRLMRASGVPGKRWQSLEATASTVAVTTKRAD